MIQTQGFESIQNIGSLADEINRWLVNNSQAMDSKFRLINIQYSSASESVPNTNEIGRVNYSALVVYDVVEAKKTEDITEPLDASGIE
jgi:hypothetical protein